MDSYVYQLLRAWGRFRRMGWEPGLGHSRVNVLFKVPGKSEETIPDDVIFVDRGIGTLPREFREALTCSYVDRLSSRKGAEKLKISRNLFTSYLKQAEQRVAGIMTRIETA